MQFSTRMSSLRRAHRTPSLTSLSTISSTEGTAPIFNAGSSSNPFADPESSTSYNDSYNASYNTPPTPTYPSNTSNATGYRFPKSPTVFTEGSTKAKPKLRRFVKTFIHPVSSRREKKSEKARREQWAEQERVANIEQFLESGRGHGQVEGVRVQAGGDVWSVE